LREVLGGMLADGARVTGFRDRRAYVVDRTPAPPPAPHSSPPPRPAGAVGAAAEPASAEGADPSDRSRR
ncbi:hypothetical protein DZF91_26215, partial [Actinomadura logoneensis]